MRREERGEESTTHAPLSADPIWKAPQKADEPSRRRRFVPLLPPTFKLRTNEFHADVRGRRPLRPALRLQVQPTGGGQAARHARRGHQQEDGDRRAGPAPPERNVSEKNQAFIITLKLILFK